MSVIPSTRIRTRSSKRRSRRASPSAESSLAERAYLAIRDESLRGQLPPLFAARSTPAEHRAMVRIARDVDRLFVRLATCDQAPALRFVVHQRHVQLHMRIAQGARSELLRQMIERNHVLILNWLFDIAGRRTPLPAQFRAQLAAVTSATSA